MKKVFIFYLSLFFSSVAIAQSIGIKTDSLKKLLAIAREDTNKVILLKSLSDDYLFNDPDSAVLYAQSALSLAKKLNYEQTVTGTEILWTLAFAYSALGDYTHAVSYWNQNISLSLQINSPHRLMWAYGGLADSYRDQENYAEALKNIEEAHRISPDKNDSMMADRVKAVILEASGHPDSALFYLNRAAPLMKTEEWDYHYYLLGNIYGKKGQDSAALEAYREAIRIAAREESRKDLIDIHNSMSELFWKEKKTDSAIFYANLILQDNKGAYHRIGALRAASLLAEIYAHKNNKDSIIKFLDLKVALNERLFNQKKTQEVAAITFNEQLHRQELRQQLEQSELKYRSRLNIYALLAGLLILAILAIGLWRRNIYKQRSFAVLQKQKQETVIQKERVEETLQELKSTQAQLIQSEKMASLGELTAGIAHEIQNPLNFVNNFSEVNDELMEELQAERSKPKAERNEQAEEKIINDIKENEKKISFYGRRADSIVKGMLQHSRAGAGQKELTDINRLADEYLRLSYHGMRSKDKSFNVELKTDFDESIVKINVVPSNIGRVLLNILNNAFYAVNERNREEGERYKAMVLVQTKKINDKVEIRVADNGKGIPQKLLNKIFQPFFTTKPAGQGTGLGLSISYDIIKAHGGEIKVETKEEEGTDFIIHLPLNKISV
jgi:two-component system, NtrC family, sensor kinase